MVNHCSRRGWKVRATRVTLVTLVTSNVIQGTSETRETLAIPGTPDMHRTTLRTQGMLTLARLPPRHRCLAASATLSLAHNSQGSQTRRLVTPRTVQLLTYSVLMALHHRSTISTAAFVVSIDERLLPFLSVRSRR